MLRAWFMCGGFMILMTISSSKVRAVQRETGSLRILTNCGPGNSNSGTACDLCAAGQYQSVNSASVTSCSVCPSGQYSSYGASVCIACGLGDSQALSGQTFCTSCAAGYFSSTIGLSGCVQCEAGYYSATTRATLSTTCSSCAAGYFAGPAESACVGCTSGYYSAVSASSSCFVCSIGTYQSASGSTSCFSCSAGSYCSTPGLSAGIKCTSGKSSLPGASSCDAAVSVTVSTQSELLSALSNSNVILLTADIYLTSSVEITGISGLVMNGAGHKVDGQGLCGCFRIGGGSSVLFANLKITNGYSIAGGGIYMTGQAGSTFYGSTNANYGNTKLTLLSCTVTFNKARYDGGGIYATGLGSISISKCLLSKNLLTEDGSRGGAISVLDATVSISASESIFDSNLAPFGAAVSYGASYVTSTNQVTFSYCTFSGNAADDNGGAIHVFLNSGTLSLTMIRCTLTMNSAATGGGLSITTAAVTLMLAGCTFSNNAAASGADISSSSTVGVYSTCGENKYNTGSDAKLSCIGCSSSVAADYQVGHCTQCPVGHFSCCGAVQCSPFVPNCGASDLSVCKVSTPQPSFSPAPTHRPTFHPVPRPTPAPSLQFRVLALAPLKSTYSCVSDTITIAWSTPRPSTCTTMTLSVYSYVGDNFVASIASVPFSVGSKSFSYPWVPNAAAYCPGIGLTFDAVVRLTCANSAYYETSKFILTGSANSGGPCSPACSAGYTCSGGTCAACGAGQISTGGASTCTSCAAGMYATNEGAAAQVTSAATLCGPCYGGYFTATASSVVCSSCGAGSVSVVLASACSTCPKGQYATISVTDTDGGQSTQVISAATSCNLCPKGFFASSASSIVCQACIGSSFSLRGSASCNFCVKSFYLALDDTCNRCMEGTICDIDGVSTQTQLTIAPNFWRAAATSILIYSCTLPAACLGGIEFESGYCAAGYQGPLCAVCINGFFLDARNNACVECGNSRDNAAALLSTYPAIFLYVVLAAGILWGFLRDYHQKQQFTFQGFFERIISGQRAGGVNAVATNSPTKGTRSFWTWLEAKLKSFVGFAQIIVAIAFNFNVVFPSKFRRLIDAFSILAFDFLPSLGLDCILGSRFDYIDKMVVVTSAPLLVAAVLVPIAFGLSRTGRNRGSQICAYIGLVISFVVLVGVSTTLFHYFKIRKFKSAGSYLWADYSVNCASNRYQSYVPYAAVMIVIYPIGIPVMYACLLWQQRVILCNSEYVRNEATSGNPNIGHLYFLSASWKPEFYFFEVVECLRRLLLAAVVGIISDDAAAGPVIAILLCLAFTYVYDNYKPFLNVDDNNLAIVLANAATVIFLASLMIKVNVTSDSKINQEIFGGILTALFFVGPASAVLNAAYPALLRRDNLSDSGEADELELASSRPTSSTRGHMKMVI